MTNKPKCIIVTGRPSAGKATLCKKLQKKLWMPLVSRDEIKEGYVNTFGSDTMNCRRTRTLSQRTSSLTS